MVANARLFERLYNFEVELNYEVNVGANCLEGFAKAWKETML